MVLLQSDSKTANFTAPAFTLIEPKTGVSVSLSDQQGEHATVVMFICNHCPFVLHINETIRQLATDFTTQGVGFIAISSNDAKAYPQDGPEKMAQVAYPFPYLYDETQAIAKAYGAVCTPDFFVFDSDMQLVYRGRLDASSPGNGQPTTGEEMRNALQAIITKQPIPAAKPSMGCSIKWK